MKKIFMVSYGGGHSKILIEIYKKIKEEISNIEVVYLGMTTSKQNLLEEKINFKTLEDYDMVLRKEIENKFSLEEFEIEYKFNEFVSESEHELYNNICLKELLEKYDKKYVKKLLLTYGKRIYLPINNMKRILEFEKPDLIITTNAPRFERAALIAGKELKIPTMSIEDLYGEPNEIDIEIDFKLKKNYYSKTFGEYICVIDEIAKKKIEEQIFEKNKIYITGNPNFDKLVRKKAEKFEIKKNNKKKILYLAQQTEYFYEIISEIERIALKKNEFIFEIKLHPNQKINLQKTNNFLVKDGKLEDIILNSDLVITEYSTSGIEALILQKKVLSLQLDLKRKCPIPFEKFANTLVVKRIEDLENYIEKFISEKFDYKKDNFNNLNIATKKILQIILKILNGEDK